MNLPVPGVGTEIGPNYAQDINSCLSILDSHTHTVGNGVAITPTGLNINSDLSFIGNNAINLRSVRLSTQSGVLSGATDLGCLYNNAGDLYFNDGSGNQIAITASGGIAGSPGSIANLVSPASATYTAASKTFTWASGTSGKAAAMDNGSVTIRQTDTASANGITLTSPNSLASPYSLTLFTGLPGSTQYVSCDSSGNLGTVSADTIGVAMTSTGANSIANARTRAVASTVGIGGVAISASSGAFTTTAVILTNVTNLSVTITTTGRPVFVGMIPDGSLTLNHYAYMGCSGSAGPISSHLAIYNGSFIVDQTEISSSGTEIGVPPSFYTIDTPAAGTITYQIQTRSLSGSSVTSIINDCALTAYEL